MKKITFFNLLILSSFLVKSDKINCAAKSSVESKISLEEQLIKSVNSFDFDEVKRLLLNGANVDYKDAKGMTALMHAANNGDPRITENLLNVAKANHELSDIHGKKIADYIKDDVILGIYNKFLKSKDLAQIKETKEENEVKEPKDEKETKRIQTKLSEQKSDNLLTKKFLSKILDKKNISFAFNEVLKYLTIYSKVPQIIENNGIIKKTLLLKNGNCATVTKTSKEEMWPSESEYIRLYNDQGTLVQVTPPFKNSRITDEVIELQNGNLACVCVISVEEPIPLEQTFLKIWKIKENTIDLFPTFLGFNRNFKLIEIGPNRFCIAYGNHIIEMEFEIQPNKLLGGAVLFTYDSNIIDLIKLNNENLVSVRNNGITVFNINKLRNSLNKHFNESPNIIRIIDDYLEPIIINSIPGDFETVIKLDNGFAAVQSNTEKNIISIFNNEGVLEHSFKTEISIKKIIESTDGKIIIYGIKKDLKNANMPLNVVEIWNFKSINDIEYEAALEKTIDLSYEPINIVALANNKFATFNHTTIDIWSTNITDYHDVIKLKRPSLQNKFHSIVHLFEHPNGNLFVQTKNNNFYVYKPNGIAIKSEQEKQSLIPALISISAGETQRELTEPVTVQVNADAFKSSDAVKKRRLDQNDN